MDAQKKKSRKRSVTSSSQPKPLPTLFLDENTSSRLVIDALLALGFRVELHKNHFNPGTEDAVWLGVVAKKKWIAVTRDQRIRYRPNEIAAVRASGARMVFITGGNLGSIDLATLLTNHAMKLEKFTEQHNGPFMATLTRSGSLTKI
jgi:hypothetical protein